jgi:hypothetical protein
MGKMDEAMDLLKEERAACRRNPNGDGFTCVNRGKDKIFQVTSSGSSVSTQVGAPNSYDGEGDQFKVKGVDKNCRITTPRRGEDPPSVLMCYKSNDMDPAAAGINLVEMNDRLDDIRGGL